MYNDPFQVIVSNQIDVPKKVKPATPLIDMYNDSFQVIVSDQIDVPKKVKPVTYVQ